MSEGWESEPGKGAESNAGGAPEQRPKGEKRICESDRVLRMAGGGPDCGRTDVMEISDRAHLRSASLMASSPVLLH